MKARRLVGTLPPRKSAVNRADLLWLLHALPAEQAPQAAALLGFRHEEERKPKPEPSPPRPATKPPAEERPSGQRPSLRVAHFAVIAQRPFPEQARLPDEAADNAADDSTFASLQGDADQRLPARIPLSSPARLSAFLHRTLRTARPGRELDVPRLLAQLVRVRLPRRLPCRSRPRWGSEATLIVDLSLAAWPLHEDLIDLAEQAHALSAGRLPILCRDAGNGWLRRLPGRVPAWAAADETALLDSRHWLLTGDTGHRAADPASRSYWQTRCQAHLAHGGSLSLLTGRATTGWLLPRAAHLVTWEHGRRLVSVRPAAVAEAQTSRDDTESARLLAALSLAVIVEPALLRAIRLAIGLSMAGELAAWNHPDSEHCVLGMQIRRGRLEHHRSQLLGETLSLRRRIAQIIAAHHAGHYRAIRFEENALAAALAGLDAGQALADWATAARTLDRQPDSVPARELAAYLYRIGLRAHRSLWQAIPALADAYVIARREDLQAGAQIPDGLPGSALERHLATPLPAGETRPLWLAQCGSELLALRRPPQPDEFVLAECRPVAGFDLQTPENGRQWHPPTLDSERLAMLHTGIGPWIVRTRYEEIVVAEIPRPSWVLDWGRDRRGLYALAPSLPEPTVKLYWAADESGEAEPHFWPPAGRGFRSPRQAVGSHLWQGADLEYGLYLDLELAGVMQRFRWIEPGEFLMGSPEDEPGRLEIEGPQHRVTLTQGFWLADTTCTQALWQALMGNNPSRFKDDPLKPVGSVSWNEVQGFLARLAGQLAGVAVELPTEAEWEYACRAGSDRAYSGSDWITIKQANYEEKNKGTVLVKAYPPNAWGLYEMHGNVYEWCADGLRDYDSAPQENPRGSEEGSHRVMRGGAWSDGAGWLRSANRASWQPDFRAGYDDQGFRFSLRSIDQPAGAERLDQDIRPKGFEAKEWPKAGPSVSTVFPGRKDGAASADAEAAPATSGKPSKKKGASLKAPGKGKQGGQR
ncbi:MAG: SUMF1/EgtB/PvdO family nonheme iron enzyme [Candidatus Accumulibacter sp. UW25]|jgi:hypothetical protein